MAHVVAVIAAEDHDRIVFESEEAKFFEQLADVAIDAGGAGEVLAGHAADPLGVEFGEVGVGDGRVELFEGGPVHVPDGKPAGVRGAVVERDGERSLLRIAESKPADGFVGEDVGRESANGLHPAVHLEPADSSGWCPPRESP